MNNWYIQIIKYNNDYIIKEIGPYNKNKIESIKNTINHNLNHDDYYTLVISKNN